MYKIIQISAILIPGGIAMILNLIGQINIIKSMNFKPNYSELAREHGIDRRTVKKYYDGYEGKPQTRNKSSKLDQYLEEIKLKLSIKGITAKAVYEYFLDKNYDIGSYSNFIKYIKSKNLKPTKKIKGHPRFETPPGKQAQVDWKEDLKLVSKNNEEFIINVFNYKLGNSRYCHFEYRNTKTQQDVFECLISSFKATGGIPSELLFDNMSTVVDITGNKRKINNKMKAFASDFGFNISLCKPRHSYTKGKVESANKFIEWLLAYNYEFETEEDLIQILKNINKKVNQSANQTTGLPPILLFQKEKEYLQPLPSNSIIESYINQRLTANVHKDSLINYKNSKYSVPSKYINKTVTLKVIDNKLHIYFSTDLIAIHDITNKKMNYNEEHYKELISPYIKNSNDIDDIARDNLNQLDYLLNVNGGEYE
ncbi:hypothetical protein TVTCOM_18200 [Terrisporobacter vanillatitrophus]